MNAEVRQTDRISGSKQPASSHALEYQTHALGRVSRTFALTIPQLPPDVRYAIGNAYLLCRIADTIEDEPELDGSFKKQFLYRFADVVRRKESPDSFTTDLVPLLTDGTNKDERDLVANTELVMGLHQQMPRSQTDPIEKCVETMCRGMSEFVDTGSEGLPDLEQVDRYCYFVAGVVGEMITEVLCDYSEDIASSRDELFSLSSKFGSGLQLINIMKDHCEDKKRSVCWLPRSLFSGQNEAANASQRGTSSADPRIVRLLGVARSRLEKSVRYLTLIPKQEMGIRRFLGWTLAFASLTLRRIHDNPRFRKGDEVKISRRLVYSSVAAVNFALRSNRALRWLFNSTVPTLSAIESLVRKTRR